MDIDAEREKITQEIKELERILDPSSSSIHAEVSESSLDSDSEADLLPGEGLDAADPPILEEERWGEASNDEDDAKDRTLPEDPETCLQLNMVYQEVIREKLAEVSLLLAQNREQQEEIMWDLAGPKGPKVKDSKSLPLNVYIGHFMKPYFKDKVTGVGPPANEETREKAAQGIKAFEELLVTKWKHWEKALLRKSVVSDRLQRLLQPKLLKLEYLQQKQSRVPSEPERQALDKQIREAEKEIQDINQLPEEALLGNRLDNHDWEKISKVNFEGGRGAEEIRKFWQNSEHPSINKQEWSGEEVERLKAIAASHGHLEWQKVAEELGTRRSAFQCLQTFQRHNTALRRREWTQEEDHMLTQLVQEMRVGSHIPYRRIVYYMEGRDSMQLIYRWTKSLDPNLKKGFWAPEEDARGHLCSSFLQKLLQAVAKYGEQDWFKIREEVPGRSDAQCRDRYLRRLHFSLKKGRWNLKEEEQLLELIEKYGVGHWAKIASELPHRSGSQCLSKWKVMIGKRQGLQRRRRRLRRGVRWSSSSSSSSGDTSSSGGSSSGGGSSSSSSSSSEESEVELEQVQEGGKVLLSPQYVVPDMDLWVPARQSASQAQRGGAGGRPGCPAASLGPPRGSSAAQGGREEAATTPAPREELSPAQGPPGTHSTAPPRVQDSRSADRLLASSEELALEDGSRLLKVPLETVLRVLRTNTAARSRSLKEKLKQPPLPSTPLGASSGDSVAQSHVRQLWHRTFQNGRRRWRHALHQRLLDRRLLLAVTPWVGDVIVPCMPTPRRPVAQTRADSLGKQLRHARLASTPVFTLFIQLFQIDTAGCMEVVRERKVQTPRLLQEPPRAPSTPGCLFPNVTAQKAAKNASRQAECAPAPVPPPTPCGPRPKPKTVSELLREKRLREARARKAAQGPTVLAPRLLLPSPVILQPTLPPAPHGPPASGPVASNTVASPGTSASWQEAGTSAKDEGPSTLQTLPLAAASGTPPGQVPGSCHPNSLGQSQVPATSRKQGLPEALPFLPAAPSPAQLPTQPLSLTHRGGPHVAANIPLPVTWVLTAQGLLPVSVPAVVGLPRPAGTPDPTGLPVTLLPPPAQTRAVQGPQAPGLSCPWQLQASVDVGADPSPKTSPSTPPTPPPSRGPAEVDGGVACVASTSPQPDHLEAEPLWPSRLPACSDAGPGSDPGGTPGPPSGTQEPRGPPPGHEKGSLDLGLLSQESEAATLEWLRGQGGGCVPPLGSRLPYQPPALCSLRALSGLLLHKKALEHKATSLVDSRAAGGQAESRAGALQAALGLVRGQLRDNPAYLLLKARFLAAFAIPALLATLPPRGVPTTLSAATGVGSECEDEGLDEPELTAASSPDQRTPGPGEGSAPSCLETSADLDTDLDVLRTRHSRHARKRRRLL
ncbi:snRNA-activating protein complex subunit 4 isoform X1 [Lemur catta]|uniref:snRNA-activating protein complex subunit 4 isoform X1 n=1 Tax=Lemur catta TaxID=9447 RepID=UPI001E26E427|nr:snRNA-activating protein complex subunit 4 isoform X1 [Lemur catta]XP_045419077.1 snRNA-activating protein complex subunit 4 isoform X1 [Lemur catta]XP_045419078.1 snRNA-activating protein complex subunit 4 isoform X1 [Lemur catta]